MGWFAGLLGGGGNTEKVIDNVSSAISGIGTWIDERELTEEERVKFHAEAGRLHLELIKATTDENSIRSVTRRWLAWAITGMVALFSLVAIVCALLGYPSMVTDIIAIGEAFSLGWAFVAVVVFYFGVQFARAGKK